MIKNRLKSERMRKKMSQRELAEHIGVSQQTVGSWETGRTEPDQEMTKFLADFFGVSTDYLLEKTDTRELPLTLKDEKDIEKKLNELKDTLESQSGLLFSGDAMDDETREFLLASLERTIRQSKVLAKEKFTPNKYK